MLEFEKVKILRLQRLFLVFKSKRGFGVAQSNEREGIIPCFANNSSHPAPRC